MKEELDDLCAVAVQVFLQVQDGTITRFPDCLFSKKLGRDLLAMQNFRMDPGDQHFFVVGAVEDADPSAGRKTTRRTPEKIMFQFLSARMFETVDFAALRVDAGQEVTDRPVLPCC